LGKLLLVTVAARDKHSNSEVLQFVHSGTVESIATDEIRVDNWHGQFAKHLTEQDEYFPMNIFCM
jgi:hypothetical protein